MRPFYTQPAADGPIPAVFDPRREESAPLTLEWRVMADDKRLKSAFELAMERLGKSDEEAGIERRPPTDAQKKAIAEVRSFYEAKLAEAEVLHQSRLRATIDPAERAAREAEYRRDRERLSSERDAKVGKIRREP